MNNISPRRHDQGEPWFDDGNLVLLTDKPPVAFKVHRGVLARHSEIFQSMFEMPSPSQTDVETLDNCQVVRMYDLPVELSSLIKALYDGASFQDNCVEDFFYLAGILRLATKYFIAHLRTQAIHHLSQTWSHTLRGHDLMLELAIKSPEVDGLTCPYVHPLHVLNLAHETNVSVVVPSALYFLSLYPLHDILRGDHAKLKVQHPSRPSSDLSTRQMQDYTLMFQHRLDLLLDFIRRVCGQRTASSYCKGDPTMCTKAFSRLASRLSRGWMIRTGPFHYMVQAVDELAEDPNLCMPCQRAFGQDVIIARYKLWQELPSVVGLPSWKELISRDLEQSS
ncbi:hypothetical protein BKA93DRAFT_735036 [Sparassis latifolia]